MTLTPSQTQRQPTVRTARPHGRPVKHDPGMAAQRLS